MDHWHVTNFQVKRVFWTSDRWRAHSFLLSRCIWIVQDGNHQRTQCSTLTWLCEKFKLLPYLDEYADCQFNYIRCNIFFGASIRQMFILWLTYLFVQQHHHHRCRCRCYCALSLASKTNLGVNLLNRIVLNLESTFRFTHTYHTHLNSSALCSWAPFVQLKIFVQNTFGFWSFACARNICFISQSKTKSKVASTPMSDEYIVFTLYLTCAPHQRAQPFQNSSKSLSVRRIQFHKEIFQFQIKEHSLHVSKKGLTTIKNL